MPDPANSENRRADAVVREGASELASSAASATVVTSDLANEDAGEPNGQKTNIQIPQQEADQPVHWGPTGPRTERGKQRSSRNAIKSGIFSRVTLLKGESPAEYESLREGLWKALQPEDDLEKLMVEKLVSISWRYRRLLVAEGAEIRSNSAFLECDRQHAEQTEAEEISQRQKPGGVFEGDLEPVGLIWTIHNPVVLKRCLELLNELRKGIIANGFDEEHDRSLLKKMYGDPDRPHLRRTLQDEYSAWLYTAKVTEEERQRAGCATPEQSKQRVLREIDAETKRLKQYQENRESIEAERTKLEILRQSIPDFRGMDRLLRYETSLERAFDRTLTQLIRLQRMRKGQPLPPQVDVNIS